MSWGVADSVGRVGIIFITNPTKNMIIKEALASESGGKLFPSNICGSECEI